VEDCEILFLDYESSSSVIQECNSDNGAFQKEIHARNNTSNLTAMEFDVLKSQGIVWCIASNILKSLPRSNSNYIINPYSSSQWKTPSTPLMRLDSDNLVQQERGKRHRLFANQSSILKIIMSHLKKAQYFIQ
jgi:hypothetical protein